MADKTETEAAAERDLMLDPVRDVSRHPVAVVPAGTLIVDLEQYLATPLTKRGTVTLQDADSFCRYVNEHKFTTSRIFAQVSQIGASFVCILDYHGGATGVAARGQHKAIYTLKHSAEWNRWKAKDGAKFSQKDFARFLEDNLMDVVSPPSAEVVDIFTTLEATATVNFKSTARLDNGNESLAFEKTVASKAGQKGEMEAPRQMTLSIPVFEGQESTSVMLRLRHCIEDGKLSLIFELVRPHKIIESMIAKTIEDISTLTGLDPFLGIATIS